MGRPGPETAEPVRIYSVETGCSVFVVVEIENVYLKLIKKDSFLL